MIEPKSTENAAPAGRKDAEEDYGVIFSGEALIIHGGGLRIPAPIRGVVWVPISWTFSGPALETVCITSLSMGHWPPSQTGWISFGEALKSAPAVQNARLRNPHRQISNTFASARPCCCIHPQYFLVDL
jgi:hypothetical protein